MSILMYVDVLLKELREREIELCRSGIKPVKGGQSIYEIVKQQPTVNEWIPVSERLPEEEKQYLCVKEAPFSGGLYYRLCYYAKDLYEVDKYDFIHKKGTNGFYVYNSEYGYLSVNDIIAWMPIPEYRGEVE